MNNKDIIPLDIDTIRTKIHFVRGQQVMLDNDLAEIYGVETKVFNQAVKRNNERFPEYFCFPVLFLLCLKTGLPRHKAL